MNIKCPLPLHQYPRSKLKGTGTPQGPSHEHRGRTQWKSSEGEKADTFFPQTNADSECIGRLGLGRLFDNERDQLQYSAL